MYRRVDCTGGPGGPFCNMANMQRLVLPHATAGGGHNMSLLAEAPSGFVAQIEPTSPPGTRRGGVAAQAAHDLLEPLLIGHHLCLFGHDIISQPSFCASAE